MFAIMVCMCRMLFDRLFCNILYVYHIIEHG